MRHLATTLLFLPATALAKPRCGLQLPTGVTYDLSALDAMPGDIQIDAKVDAGNAAFFVHVCGSPQQQCDASDCPSCNQNMQRAGVQRWAISNPPRCAAIGDLATAQWKLQDPTKPMGGVQVNFTGGDGGRSSALQFECDELQTGAAIKTVKEDPPLHYTLQISSAQACAVVRPVPKSCGSMACGSIALILLCVALCFYFCGGAAYNKKASPDKDGLELIPQWYYWQQLPGLVSDGCAFSYRQTSAFVRTCRVAINEWRDGRGTKEMRENLAPNGEGEGE